VNPRERVEAVLFRQEADRVPFTVYEGMISQCSTERRLRNDGLCIVRLIRVYETQTPDVTEKVCRYRENGILKERKDYGTPHGDLFSVSRIVDIDAPNQTTSWYEQKLFKGPEDYRAIRYMIQNRVHTPDYERFLREQELAEGDVLLRSEIGYEPLQEILISIMRLEDFANEWKMNRDEVLTLYRTLVEDRKKIYPIVARSPARYSNYGGNVAPEIVGPRRFEENLLPDYQECAAIMHEHGKLVGSHLDGNNKSISSLIAKTDLDYVEAFTPAPDTEMSVSDALEAWPDKVLWINFPSSVHLQSAEEIERVTLDVLEQAKPGDRLIIGVTEDVPTDHWRKSFLTISRVLNTHGALPIN
jgi:hypothetical protein